MKKTSKSILAKTLAVAMAFSLVGIASGVDAEAASKPTVTKKVSVKVGKTKTVKVTSKKAVKKTTWSLTKAGKKVVALSKKAKKSVTVKGKKKGSATLTAKVTVGKKTYKLTSKITVTKTSTPNTPEPSANNPTQAPATDTPAPTQEAPQAIGNTGKTYMESQNYSIDITELNETTFTCDSKRPDGADPVKDDTDFNANGVSFTSRGDYNSGVSFYVNPCTSENDIVDISATRGDGFTGFQNGTKDVSAYDYIRIKVTANNELNLRTYNGNDQLESAGFPGSSTSETYEGGWIGPVEGYMESDGGTGMMVKDEYVTRTIFVSMADLIAKGVNPATLTAIAISPQRGGTEVTIHSIDFVKANIDVPVTGIAVTANKTELENGKSANCTAAITPDNASRTMVTWSSSDEKLATVNYAGQVRAAAEGSGKVTITATATDGSGVSGSVELTIGDSSAPVEVTTHTVDLKADGIVAKSNIYPEKDENGNDVLDAEKADDGIKFYNKANMVFVDWSAYLDANKFDLTNYKSIDVVWEVQDAEGKAVTAFASDAPGWGKIAYAASSNLNGYGDGIDVNYEGEGDETRNTAWLTAPYAGETCTLEVAKTNPADLATVAGFNLQVEKLPDGNHIVVKSITFNV